MSEMSHCVGCGKKLRDAVFCPDCGQCSCSWRCLDRHRSAHNRPSQYADYSGANRTNTEQAGDMYSTAG